MRQPPGTGRRPRPRRLANAVHEIAARNPTFTVHSETVAAPMEQAVELLSGRPAAPAAESEGSKPPGRPRSPSCLTRHCGPCGLVGAGTITQRLGPHSPTSARSRRPSHWRELHHLSTADSRRPAVRLSIGGTVDPPHESTHHLVHRPTQRFANCAHRVCGVVPRLGGLPASPNRAHPTFSPPASPYRGGARGVAPERRAGEWARAAGSVTLGRASRGLTQSGHPGRRAAASGTSPAYDVDLGAAQRVTLVVRHRGRRDMEPSQARATTAT